MLTIDLNSLPLQDNWTEDNPAQRCRAAFPLFRAVGTERSSMVYFELDPGAELGWHTDSAEEVVLVLEGTLEAEIGDERAALHQGSVAVVPTMVPHTFRNSGATIARVAGIFPEPRLVATFESTWQPAGSNVVDTDQIVIPA